MGFLTKNSGKDSFSISWIPFGSNQAVQVGMTMGPLEASIWVREASRDSFWARRSFLLVITRPEELWGRLAVWFG